MWALVTPSARQCGPPELFATLPPIEQVCWLLGSGAKCTPRCAICFDRSRFSTPGSTHAWRFSASTETMRFIFDVEITIAPSGGTAPPARPGARTAGEERARRSVRRPRRRPARRRSTRRTRRRPPDRSCSTHRVGTDGSRSRPIELAPGRSVPGARRRRRRSSRSGHFGRITMTRPDSTSTPSTKTWSPGATCSDECHEPAVALGLELVFVLVHRFATFADGIDDVSTAVCLARCAAELRNAASATPAPPSP